MREKLILFVHGLGGDPDETWRSKSGVGFRQLIEADEAVSMAADVRFWSYPTTILRLPLSKKAPGIDELAMALKTHIDNEFADSEQPITLVCHSLGGLIARKYLVEEVKSQAPFRVEKLLMYAVPNFGNNLAKIASHLSAKTKQLRQLFPESDMITGINDDWAKLKVAEKVQVKYVVAGQDGVVDRKSAAGGHGTDVEYLADETHVSCVKPLRHKDMTYRLFRRFVLGRIPVFVSVGLGRTKSQDDFVKAIEAYLEKEGMRPMTVTPSNESNSRPLKDVERRMRRCFGAVILAFERLHVRDGVTRPGVVATKKNKATERPVQDARFPTVWNQVEAAMAYTRGLPLLVLAQKGLEREAMLEEYDWKVKSVDVNGDVTQDEGFQSTFKHWRQDVIARRDKSILP